MNTNPGSNNRNNRSKNTPGSNNRNNRGSNRNRNSGNAGLSNRVTELEGQVSALMDIMSLVITQPGLQNARKSEQSNETLIFYVGRPICSDVAWGYRKPV